MDIAGIFVQDCIAVLRYSHQQSWEDTYHVSIINVLGQFAPVFSDRV